MRRTHAANGYDFIKVYYGSMVPAHAASESRASDFYNAACSRLSIVARIGDDILIIISTATIPTPVHAMFASA